MRSKPIRSLVPCPPCIAGVRRARAVRPATWLGLGAAALLIAGAGCGDAAPADGDGTASRTATPVTDATGATTDDGPLGTVAVSFDPLLDWTTMIAGDRLTVVCPIPDDHDPAQWTPNAAGLEAFVDADLVLLNGAKFESWAATASLPRSRTIETALAFSDDWLTYADSVTHSHGPAGEHTHEGIDGHTWLDPQLALRQATQVRDALATTWPNEAARWHEGMMAVRDRLDAIDRAYAAIADDVRACALVSNHPAYQYLARRYDWEIAALDVDPDAPLADTDLADIRAAVTERRAELAPDAPDSVVAVMLWESDPGAETRARLLSELGIRTAVVDPAERLTAAERATGGTSLDVLAANVERLRAAVEAASADTPAESDG